jgi:hypothetical protein
MTIVHLPQHPTVDPHSINQHGRHMAIKLVYVPVPFSWQPQCSSKPNGRQNLHGQSLWFPVGQPLRRSSSRHNIAMEIPAFKYIVWKTIMGFSLICHDQNMACWVVSHIARWSSPHFHRDSYGPPWSVAWAPSPRGCHQRTRTYLCPVDSPFLVD